MKKLLELLKQFFSKPEQENPIPKAVEPAIKEKPKEPEVISAYKDKIPKTVNEKQAMFTAAVGELLHWCNEQGMEFILAEAYRPPETAELYETQKRGIKNSLHTKKLAVDLIRYKDGKVSWNPVDYEVMGRKWETMSVMASWGGSFKDYGHISFSHGGVR